MGGFVDGIVLHQLLQWHNMLSSNHPPTTVVNLEVNMFWDGLFHAFTWIVTAVGIAVLWRAGQRREAGWPTRRFVGGLALGWGLFNVIEGLINHQLLGIHHVRHGEGEFAWDMGFLGFGVVLVVAGLAIMREPQVAAACLSAPHG
jgi:uncharacterized membrane protein